MKSNRTSGMLYALAAASLVCALALLGFGSFLLGLAAIGLSAALTALCVVWAINHGPWTQAQGRVTEDFCAPEASRELPGSDLSPLEQAMTNGLR